MGVFKRPDSDFWYIEFIYRGRRYKASSETTDKNKARALEVKMRADIVAGQDPAHQPKVTLGEAITRYIDTVAIGNPSSIPSPTIRLKPSQKSMLRLSQPFPTAISKSTAPSLAIRPRPSHSPTANPFACAYRKPATHRGRSRSSRALASASLPNWSRHLD
jgi:hypothetical protein